MQGHSDEKNFISGKMLVDAKIIFCKIIYIANYLKHMKSSNIDDRKSSLAWFGFFV